jgi:hypothetical protein
MTPKNPAHHAQKIAQHLKCIETLYEDVCDEVSTLNFRLREEIVKVQPDKIAHTAQSQRAKDWEVFANRVTHHIDGYTVPQYGDAPNDQVSEWTAEHCVNQLSKYASRFGSNARGGQDLLDLLKIAHYAQLAYDKLVEAENERK